MLYCIDRWVLWIHLLDFLMIWGNWISLLKGNILITVCVLDICISDDQFIVLTLNSQKLRGYMYMSTLINVPVVFLVIVIQ